MATFIVVAWLELDLRAHFLLPFDRQFGSLDIKGSVLPLNFLYLVLLPEAAPALAAAQQNDRTSDQYNRNDKRARQDHGYRGAFFFAERLFEEDLRKHVMLRRKAPVCLLVNRLLSSDPPVEFEHLVAVFGVYQVVIEFLHVCVLEVVDFV